MGSSNDKSIFEKSLEQGGSFIKDTVRDYIDSHEAESYIEAIEKGIYNTVAALLDSGVDEETIETMLNKYWDISRKEADERIQFGKREILKKCIHDYLWRLGKSEDQIRQIIIDTNANIKINHNLELYKYKDKPKKLLQILSED